MPRKPAKYIFSLIGVNIDKLDSKYGLVSKNGAISDFVPENTTKIENLVERGDEVVTFLDETKKLRKCTVSMIDYNNKDIFSGSHYKCFWDKNTIDKHITPIGCPIKYVPNRVVKSYFSEISRERYTISEMITEARTEEIKDNKKLNIHNQNYYETDGIFCSFNCCLAFINDKENRKDSLFRYSKILLEKMYNDMINDGENEEKVDIIPAPHWRMLKDFGGKLSIDDFRASFNKVEYVDHDYVQPRMISLGRIFEDKIKL